MQKIIIAVDIDNTILTYNGLVYKLLCKVIRPKADIANGRAYSFVRKEEYCPNPKAVTMLGILNAKNYKEIDCASEILQYFKQNNAHIILLTRRPKVKIMSNLTLQSLKQHNVPFDQLVMGCTNKAQFCELFNAQLFIDDNIKTCTTTSEHKIKTLYFQKDKPINKQIGPCLYQTNSWLSCKAVFDSLKHSNDFFDIPTTKNIMHVSKSYKDMVR